MGLSKSVAGSKCFDYRSLGTQPLSPAHDASIASSASSPSSSIFSLDCVSSQSSVPSSEASSVDASSESESSGEVQGGSNLSSSSESHTLCFRTRGDGSNVADTAVPPEQRQHPRRTQPVSSNGSSSSTAAKPPSLVRQSDRRVDFVDSLVDSASNIVEAIWPTAVIAHRNDGSPGCKGVLPLRTFIQETLRRSRTSYSTLQVALYYLIVIRPHVPKRNFTMEQPRDSPCSRAMQCGRRMFLSALILASKYLQDRNYSARAWSKISGLNTAEINQNEMAFLDAVNWKLHIPEPIFQRWADIVLKFTSAGNCELQRKMCWRGIIPHLTPDLDGLESIDPTFSLPPDRRTPRKELANVNEGGPSPCRTPVPNPFPTKISIDRTPIPSRGRPPTLEPAVRGPSPPGQAPALGKMQFLPTPTFTPEAINTPAVGVSGLCSRRASMGTAMSQAQNVSVQRSTLDERPPCTYSRTAPAEPFPACPRQFRRSSLARSTSSASSPESMVSDASSLASSLSSRSSYLSSMASTTYALPQPQSNAQSAPRRAELQNPKVPRKMSSFRGKTAIDISPIDEGCQAHIVESPESYPSYPDMSSFSLGTPTDVKLAREAATGLCELSGAMPRSNVSGDSTAPSRPCRKRGRTSENTELQELVRETMATQARKHGNQPATVLPDRNAADSFMLDSPGSQLPIPLLGPTKSKFTSWDDPRHTQGFNTKRTRYDMDATKCPWIGNVPKDMIHLFDFVGLENDRRMAEELAGSRMSLREIPQNTVH